MNDAHATDEDLRAALDAFAKAMAQAIADTDPKCKARRAMLRAMAEQLDEQAKTLDAVAESALGIAAEKLLKR